MPSRAPRICNFGARRRGVVCRRLGEEPPERRLGRTGWERKIYCSCQKLNTGYTVAESYIFFFFVSRDIFLRRMSAATLLLRLWVRIPLGAWMFVSCEGCVLSGRGLCDELITHPEESYWVWCVVVCDLETGWTRRPLPTGGCCAKKITVI